MSLGYLSSWSSRWLVGVSALLTLPAAMANERVQVVTSFSILADMVENVGGDHVDVTSLVAADGDAHVYSPSPGDARSLANADLVVFNGLLFEGWMERLISASDYSGAVVTATDGIQPLSFAEHDDHDGHDHEGHGHDEHAHEEHGHEEHGHEEHGHDDHDHEEHDHAAHADEHAGHEHGDEDPHAWQDMQQAKVYVANIRDGLIAADADNADTYRANAEQYLQEMAEVDAEIRALIDEIPASTSVITGHDSFGYFSSAYGVTFLSPVGLSTEADPSGASMAALVDVIEQENVKALFHENMTNQSIITQLAEETGLPIAGTLYADALASEGEASTYLGMMRHNAQVLHDALAQPGHEESGHDDHEHSHDDHDHSEHSH
ncbi:MULTISPECIES: metal ABC transporter solute-binding protein, Zn/Mn family [unclassified Halomonas]|uniref:metal ABC transporter solute-binding protein, Zn/Mn family n=1 Tax=unclassified Halomonas TaxID=2609666 RepID=UPI001CF119D8|nr:MULTISPECIES: zinc ABC transporter substrate-binding protein [unclassified Halomonas]MCA8866021.1 metal ABC transporter substrate-binding protein [Halomonas sp. SBBP1]UZH10374.1 zinc ABC transporter substrate-binding protein [Halomonas sp. BDJS001]